jgi:hypothetical protein
MIAVLYQGVLGKQIKEYDIKSMIASKGNFKGKEFPLGYLDLKELPICYGGGESKFPISRDRR